MSESSVAVVLVTYYIRQASEAISLVDDLARKLDIKYSEIILIDNSGLISTRGLSNSNISVLAGTNQYWEFSGWLEGLAAAKGTAAQTLLLMNDSYQRNWELSKLSVMYLKAMYRSAQRGRVSAWLDNFSHFRRPRFSRRPNSRILFTPRESIDALYLSLSEAINLLRQKIDTEQPLFTNEEQARLTDWAATQPGRWAQETLTARNHRIFLEHHMLDRLPTGSVRWFPRTLPGSWAYALARRLFAERR